MNRRSLITSFVSAGVITLAGCSSRRGSSQEGKWNPTIKGNLLDLSPGEESTITVQATDVGGFSFHLPPEGIDIGTSRSERDVSPSPDSGADSAPPQWFWSSRTDVTVEVPVFISDTIEPSEYQYGVTVYSGEDSDQTAQAEFDITITTD